VRLLSRETLGLAPPRSPLSPIRRPVDRCFLHHTVTPDFGTDYRRTAQTIQRVAFERGFSDSSYPAGVTKDGTVLELRGFDWIGAHTVGSDGHSYNSHTTAIVLVGNYEIEDPTPPQIDAVRALLALIRIGGYLTIDAPLDPHRSVKSTACPGQRAVDRLGLFRTPWIPAAPRPEPTTTEDEMLLRLEGKPAVYIGGLPHLVPGPLVDEYAEGRKTGIVELPNTDVGREHYERVAELAKANN
jgi:N-acetylmuramoyl-L-alanine amidase